MIFHLISGVLDGLVEEGGGRAADYWRYLKLVHVTSCQVVCGALKTLDAHHYPRDRKLSHCKLSVQYQLRCTKSFL